VLFVFVLLIASLVSQFLYLCCGVRKISLKKDPVEKFSKHGGIIKQ